MISLRVLTTQTAILSLVLFVAASPVSGQGFERRENDAPETPDLDAVQSESMDGVAADLENGLPIYVGAVHGDWDVRCAKTEDGPDPCHLYQLLKDDSNNPVSEINILPISGDDEFVAVATVVTPLETLLTRGLAISVDDGEVRQHSFQWCGSVGCVSRIGLNEADLMALKRGLRATLGIFPAGAANRRIELTVSLTGFSAGFKDVTDRLEN